MRELDVREAVRAGPLRKYIRDSDSRVIDELAICLGEARIDIAVVNGKLSGYELKSESDTLTRLPRQIDAYGRVFDEVTLVLDRRHVDAAALIVPGEWGLIEVSRNRQKKPTIKQVRSSMPLRAQDPYSIAQLLWKSEALEVLSRVTRTQAPVSKSRSWIWTRLVESLSLPKLKHEVRQALKHRLDWRT